MQTDEKKLTEGSEYEEGEVEETEFERMQKKGLREICDEIDDSSVGDARYRLQHVLTRHRITQNSFSQ